MGEGIKTCLKDLILEIYRFMYLAVWKRIISFALYEAETKAERILSKDLGKKKAWVLAKYLISKSIDYIKYECSGVFL